MVTHHRGHVGRPHLLVLGLGGRDRRRVQPEELRLHQLNERRAIGRHRQWMHRRRLGRLERADDGLGLAGRAPRPGRRRIQPPAWATRRPHRLRRRTLPRLTGQIRRHRPERRAADPNSAANPSQAAAARTIGADPAPENISAELIFGGST